jgi:hypothetical protein
MESLDRKTPAQGKALGGVDAVRARRRDRRQAGSFLAGLAYTRLTLAEESGHADGISPILVGERPSATTAKCCPTAAGAWRAPVVNRIMLASIAVMCLTEHSR